MLFTEQDLNILNPFNILDNATYLTEEEDNINPKMVPVTEVSRIGYGVVRFDDVDRLAESHGIDYIDAMYAIAEASDINPEQLAVSVPEEELIAYPELVNELANIVVAPLSEYDYEYQYVTECVNAWLESGNEEYIDLLLEMNQEQWDYVNSRKFLTQDQKNAIGRKYYALGDKRVDDAELQRVIKSYHTHGKLHGRNDLHSELVSRRLSPDIQNSRRQNARYQGKTRKIQQLSTQIDTLTKNYQDNEAKNLQLQRDLDTANDDKKKQQGHIDLMTRLAKENDRAINDYKGKTLHRAADKLYAAGNWMKNNKGKTALGVGLGAAAIGGGIYAYKQYKNKPRSVIAKRIAALRSIYSKFMRQVQSNPSKANILKRAAAKILSVIDKLMGYLQNAADGR